MSESFHWSITILHMHGIDSVCADRTTSPCQENSLKLSSLEPALDEEQPRLPTVTGSTQRGHVFTTWFGAANILTFPKFKVGFVL